MKLFVDLLGFSLWFVLFAGCTKESGNNTIPGISLSVNSPFTTWVDSTIALNPALVPESVNYTYLWIVDTREVSTERNFDYTPREIGEHNVVFTIRDGSGETATTTIKVVALKPAQYKVVGYLPAYTNANPASIRWDALTHLCFAFVGVNNNGSLNENDIKTQIRNVVSEGHKKGVAVLVSVGGGGTTNFSDCLLHESARKLLVENLVAFAKNYEIDGLDIDYEEFEGSSSGASDQDLVKRAALEDLYKDLRQKLPSDKFLTAAVSASWENPNWGYFNCYTNTMHQYLDFVGLMIYDQTGTYSSSPYGQHSGYQEHFIPSINHWLNNRNLPLVKLVAGVPFYGYKFKDTSGGLAEGIAYKDILSAYPDESPEKKDHVGLVYYNGKETILQKSDYIKMNSLGGIMIWEISQDTDDLSKSLLLVIKDALMTK